MQSELTADAIPGVDGESAASGATPPLIVGIGGSAGAIPALTAMLETLGGDVPLAIIVALHLSPDHESHMAEILQRASGLTVSQVRERTRIEGGHVYVIAPCTHLITEDGHLQPIEAGNKRPHGVVDTFFRSLAEAHRENAVGVVVSGTGRDGSLGLLQIKEYGGLTLAQSVDDCEHGDMPAAAGAAGAVDLMLSAPEIGRRLRQLAFAPHPVAGALAPELSTNDEGADPHQAAEHALVDLLTSLRLRTRHDFRNYKRATILRRLERRIQVHGLANVAEYHDFVRDNPDEFGPLLSDMLISVTNFFRDPDAFQALQHEVIPQVMNANPPGDEVRIWIPACASGEEAYSVAILLQECADRMRHPPKVQVFASDINDAALDAARLGAYPANIAADVSEARLRAFFEQEEDRYRVRSMIREMVVFARHNVLADPPFSRLDLICCRNLLIYLDRTAQAAVFEMFAYALKPGGYLFLGNAESVDAATADFEVISKEHRIYRLRGNTAAGYRTHLPPRLVDMALPAPTVPVTPGRSFTPRQDEPLAALHAQALMAASPPSVLINAAHEIVRVSSGAGRYVSFGEGVPTRNLLNNVAPDVRLELNAALLRASVTGGPVHAVFRRGGGDGKGPGDVLSLAVHPVADDDGARHWLVLFSDAVDGCGTVLPAAESNDSTDLMLRRLEEENRSLKAHLQEVLDRSAVSHEELKASNEELQAINEELRSAKEELETSKEELQSVNEELTTVNTELRIKVDEAGQHNDDLRNLMDATDIATVFVDQAMQVKRFTPRAAKLFSLIPSDVGRPLMDVKSRLRYDRIVEDANAAFQQLQPIERSVMSVDDEHYLARILPYRTSHDKIGGAVLTFVDVTQLRRAEQQVRESEDRLRAAIATSGDFCVISTDGDGRILTWNRGAEVLFGYTADEIRGQPIDILFTEEDRARGVPDQERWMARRDGRAADERRHLRKDGTTFFCSGVMTPLATANGQGFVKIARDVSESKHLEERQRTDLGKAQKSAAAVRERADLKDRFLAVMSHELKQPLNLILVNAELLVRLPEARNSPALQRVGDTIIRAVSAQETIVNDLLDLSRVQTGKLHLRREPCDVADIVQRFGEAMIGDAAQKDIELHIEVPPEAVICDCDPVRIEQVVWNLLGNAIKFTPEGGRVRASLAVEDGMARFEVTDSGIGMSADSLGTVFDLFNQGAAENIAGQRRPGLGIGLALVRELVTAHGGRIEAASPGKGQGSTFTVWLPVAVSPAAGLAAVQQPAPLGQRILMVDDNRDSLDAMATLMEMEGASVTTASSGEEALALLQAGDYDVLLSDIGMPGMNGLELIRRALALDPPKRFRSIALTGYGSPADQGDALNAGFDAFLTKPVSLARLRQVLEGSEGGRDAAG